MAGYNKNDKAFLNEAFEKLFRSVGINIGTFTDFLSDNNEIVVETPTALYVETTGDDRNPGTKDKPFKTIQAAIDYTAGFKRTRTVTINVGVGNFAGFRFSNLNSSTLGYLASSGITVSGTIIDATLSQGNVTEAITAYYAPPANSNCDLLPKITCAAANWATDELVNKFVALTSTTGVTSYRTVVKNTATEIYLNFSTTVTTAYQLRIMEPGTVIDSIYSIPPGATPTSGSLIWVGGRVSNGSLSVRNCKLVAGTSVTGLRGDENFAASFTNCRFEYNNTDFFTSVTKNSSLSLNSCIAKSGSVRYLVGNSEENSSFSFGSSTYVGNGQSVYGLCFRFSRGAVTISGSTIRDLYYGLGLMGIADTFDIYDVRLINCSNGLNVGGSSQNTSLVGGTCLRFQRIYADNITSHLFALQGDNVVAMTTNGSYSANRNNIWNNIGGYIYYVLDGARMEVVSGQSTTPGTQGEIYLDGTGYTFANLTAATKKTITDPLTLSKIREI